MSLLASHRREEHESNGWNGSLEAQVDSVVYGLRAHNSSLLGIQLESSERASKVVVFDALEVLSVHDDVAGDVVGGLALEPDYLVDNHIFVDSHGLVLDGLDDGLVALSASDEDLAFHQFDESLYHGSGYTVHLPG